MSETPNHNYNTPAEGTEDWHIPLNDNAAALDTDVEIRDTEATIGEYNPKAGAKFFATDTESVFIGDGNQWNQFPSTGRNPTFESVEAESVSGEVYVKNFDGADLATKLQNALAALPGSSGRVRITPKDDGTPWAWGSAWTIDPSQYRGVHLDVDPSCVIEYGGSGWQITVEPSISPYEQVSNGSFFRLTGGIWNATGNPDGFVRVRDTQLTKLSPDHVHDYYNGNSDGTAFRLENYNHFCEDTQIKDVSLHECDIGIDFAPADVTGGSGTPSFQQTLVDGCVFRQIRNIGVRIRGKVQFSSFHHLTLFPGADGFTGLYFDGNMDRSVINMLEIENAEPFANTTGIDATGSNASVPPMMLQYGPVGLEADIDGNFPIYKQRGGGLLIDGNDLELSKYDTELKITDTWVGSPKGASVLFNKADTDQWRVQGGDGVFKVTDEVNSADRLTVDRDGAVDVSDGPVAFTPQDVRNISAASQGWVAYHDGSGSNTEGPAFCDGTQWISQLDGSVIK